MNNYSPAESQARHSAFAFERAILSALRASATQAGHGLIEDPADSSIDALLVTASSRFAVEIKYSPRSLKESAAQAARFADRARRAAGHGSSALLILGSNERDALRSRNDENSDPLKNVVHAAFRAKGFNFLIVPQGGPTSACFVAWRNGRGGSESRWVEDFSAAVGLCIEQNLRQFAESTLAMQEPVEPKTPSDESFLLVASEWSTSKGGISSFNLELAKALVKTGRRVCVAVPSASDTEIAEAEALNVELAISKHSFPGITGLPALLTGVRFLGKTFTPDVIVGHGRIIGPYAAALQAEFSRPTKRVHIVHMDPEALERAKEGDLGKPRTQIAAERKKLESELANSASVVAGVGPRLTSWINDVVSSQAAPDAPPVIEIIPGLRNWGSRRTVQPSQKTFLFSGRVEDFESKGVSLAVEAMALAKIRRPNLSSVLRLAIRGVPAEHSALSARINELIKDSGLDVVLREFTTEASELRADLFESSAVLMPSLHEGFGLSAYEAIAADVPVLVSNKSGLGDLIASLQTSTALGVGTVIEVGTPAAVEKWADAICSIIDNPLPANAAARDLRVEIESRDYWTDSIERLLQALNSSS